MIYDPICFEPDNIDKHIDYNFSLETSYYCSQYSSPTPSTPLGSPTSSLILDDMTVHQHQQSLSLSSTSTTSSSSMVPVVPQQQPLHNDFGNNDDWLLDPFYDVGSFSYQPLAISPAETNELMNAAAQSLNCPQFQQSMIMAESNEIPIGSLVSPHSSGTTVENPGTNNYDQHFQQRQHHPSTYSIKLENTLPLLTESSSTALSQAKPQAKNSYNAMTPPITARDLNNEYPTASLQVTNYAPSSSNGSTPMVTPTSSTSSSSVTRPAPRKKKARQSPSSFQCDFPGCQKSFTRPYNLNSHRRTHTNEKPFDCPHCPKTFARQHDRNRHAKLHSGVKPFLCLFCSKSFARQDALSRHQLWSDEHKVIGCSILNRKNGKDSSK